MNPTLTWIDLDESQRERVLRRLGERPSDPRRRASVPVLAPHERTLAASVWHPPAGFWLEQAVICAHGADRAAVDHLRGTLRAIDPPLAADPSRLAVFAEPSVADGEAVLHPVTAPNGGAFRPAVWIARFGGPRGVRLRVAVLTVHPGPAAPSCLGLVTEAAPSVRRASRPSRALADLLLSLPGLATRPLPAAVGGLLSGLADEVGRTRFPGPVGMSGAVTFHAPGLDRVQRPWVRSQRASRVLVVTPAVRRGPLDDLAALEARARIVASTREQLEALPPGTLDRWQEVFALDGCAAEFGPGGGLLAIERGFDVTWWLGSADLAADAWSGRHLDLLAEVRGRKGRDGGKTGHGIGRFLRSGFGALCPPHRSRGGSAPS